MLVPSTPQPQPEEVDVSRTTSPDKIPYVREWGAGWQVRVRPFPEEILPTLAAAMQRAGELLELRARGVRQATPVAIAGMTLGSAADGYLRTLERKGGKRGPLSPEGLKHYRYTTRPWRETDPAAGAALDADGTPFALRQVQGLQAFELDDWLEDRSQVALTSARNERQGVLGSLTWAQRRNVRVPPACFELEVIKVGRRRRAAALSAFELAWLVDATPKQGRNMMSLRGTLGIRGKETFLTVATNVDLAGRTIHVPAEIAKERREKTLPLDETETEIVHRALFERPAGSRHLFARAEGGPWNQGKWYERVFVPGRELAAERWRQEFGDGATPFDGFDGRGLRRTATTLMRKAGLSPELIARRLGHNDGGALVLSTYSDAGTDDRLRAELDRLGSIREAAA
jgi:hypothetical protein